MSATATRRASRRGRKEPRRLEVSCELGDLPRRAPELTLEAARAVTLQLGYVPKNLVRVGAWCPDSPGDPAVAVLYPLLTNELGGRYDASNPRGTPGWRRGQRTPRVKQEQEQEQGEG